MIVKPLTGTSCRQCRGNLDHKRHVERGAAAVEMALVMPLLILMVMGIIDFGRIFNGEIQLSQAAREGARIAALGSPTFVVGDVGDRTRAALFNPAFQGAGSTITVHVVDINGTDMTGGAEAVCTGATYFGQVTVTINYQKILFGPSTLTQKAVMKCAG